MWIEGKLNKKRSHLLINPGKYAKLPTKAKAGEVELNVKSITHIVSMEPSVADDRMIDRTTKLAEITNKPIITSKISAEKFKDNGLSVRQLRILGFEEEVVEGLKIDPVYKEEIDLEPEPVEEDEEVTLTPEEEKPTLLGFGKKLMKNLNPLNWEVLSEKQIYETELKKKDIDPTKPLAIVVTVRKNQAILIPLDARGIKFRDALISGIKPWLLVLPNQALSESKMLADGAKKVLFTSNDYDAEDIIIAPGTHNQNAFHDVYIGGNGRWIEI